MNSLVHLCSHSFLRYSLSLVLFSQNYSIEIKLICNIVLIFAVQHSNSVMCIYILFQFFSITVYDRILNIVP